MKNKPQNNPQKKVTKIVLVDAFTFIYGEICNSISKINWNFTLLFFQGLFHPARKVRDVYWKIYNNLYIGSQDALVAGFPRIANDAKNTYIKYELDYVL